MRSQLNADHDSVGLLTSVRGEGPATCSRRGQMRKDMREFIRWLEAVGLTVESTPGHYHLLRDAKPLRKQNGMPLRCRSLPTRSGGVEPRSSNVRKLGIDL